jgi:hypothetical protein
MKKFYVIDKLMNPDIGPQVWATTVHLTEASDVHVVLRALKEANPHTEFRSRETECSVRDLNMRDQFAMSAWSAFSNAPIDMHYSALAELAYKVADEMLQARLK